MADIGLGNRLAPLIARRLLPEGEEQGLERRRENCKPLLIKGTEGTVISFGKCCRPLPGDAIMGYLSAGRGIVIHRVTCRNVADYKHNPEKWIEVEWESDISNDFPVELRLDMTNKRGTLAAISAAISAADANIENINTMEKDGITTNVNLTLSLRDRNHLALVIRRLRTLPEVLRISRRP
ncbi:MAG: hypothetical protein HC808_20645 [Candidatus Competibacteraceae bacterium]|nr:hypothetical protein [Candidatus Competibacteraceae bacterium]